MGAKVLRQQFAYENLVGGVQGLSNPPFLSGAAGRLAPFLQRRVEGGGVEPARILRGFIRRTDIEVGETRDRSRARLFFMYNPAEITRDYVSYLDQTALDPFNTVFDSGNMVAPPSILDFTFSIFFDRQEEATDSRHPGVFVDYQFFDLVVRNVVPEDPAVTNNTLPDNGVMMVNPREITVVFSPQITVSGRPLNARVSFLKFTHRMVPTRMQIDLTIRATYMGPLRPEGTYKAEEFVVQDTVPLGAALPQTKFTTVEVEIISRGLPEGLDDLPDLGFGNVGTSGGNIRQQALAYAQSHVAPSTDYSLFQRDAPMALGMFTAVDCSSLVARSYRGIGAGTAMGWGEDPDWSPSTHTFMASVNNNTFKGQVFPWSPAFYNNLSPGDILLRVGHVGFFVSKDSDTSYTLFDAASSTSTPQVGARSRTFAGSDWTHVLRPNPPGWVAQVGPVTLPGGGLLDDVLGGGL